jgi:hypothetical protein
MRFSRAVIPAYLLVCGVLIAGAVGFASAVHRLNYYLIKEPVELRLPLDTVPTTLGRWQRIGYDQRFSDTLVEELGTRQYLDRTYALDGDPTLGVIQLHLAYYTGTIDDVPHIPERCWDVNGLERTVAPIQVPLSLDRSRLIERSGVVNRATGIEYAIAEVADPVTGRRTTVHMPIGDPVMTVTEFQDPKRPKHRMLGGYFFIANGRITPSAYGVRALAFERSERFAYYLKVQLNVGGVLRDAEDSLMPRFVESAEDLLGHLLPHLMRRLPDWPTYERISAGEADEPRS